MVWASLCFTVTSDFIAKFNSLLQPDPDGGATALLCVLIYKLENIAEITEI